MTNPKLGYRMLQKSLDYFVALERRKHSKDDRDISKRHKKKTKWAATG